MIRWAELLGLLVATTSCGGSVLRVEDGNVHEGRPIQAAAYAAYLQGRLDESEGHWVEAEASYRRVIELDGDSAEAWARLGWLSCEQAPQRAEESFEHARRISPHLNRLWLLRARCARLQHKYDRAREYAEQALISGPTNSETSEALAEICVAQGDLQRARAVAWGLVALDPSRRQSWELLLGIDQLPDAERTHAQTNLAQLTLQLRRRAPLSSTNGLPVSAVAQRALRADLDRKLDAALVRRDAASARSLATWLGLSTLELVRRALDLGAFDLALTEAEMLNTIAPNDIPIWVMALQAADQAGNQAIYLKLLAAPPKVQAVRDQDLLRRLYDVIERRTSARSAGTVGAADSPVR